MNEAWHCRQIPNGQHPIIVCERGLLLNLLDLIADHEACTADPHGGCQTHGFDPGEGCPVAAAQVVLRAAGMRP